MSGYKYIDPTEYGYKKVNFSRKQHNRLFPNRKAARFTSYDYYIEDSKLIIHSKASLSWIFIVTIGFPVVVLLGGVAELQRYAKRIPHTLQPKEFR